jgi:SNF2 family DNA or RNA helicase
MPLSPPTATSLSRSEAWSVDPASLEAFQAALSRSADTPEWFALRRAAERLALVPGFDTLITLNANTIKELPHQIDVALRVLRPPMSGRALLADEVGLGKTIEAGIVLKELAVRGLARRVLILTPAALVDQWQGELESKFFEAFATPLDPEDWHRSQRGIASYDRAISKRHADAILHYHWDLVIVDEAHKAKNHTAKRYRFLQQLRRNYLLLLTATPLQNNLRELYNLITLLRPGQLGTWREFQRQHVGGDVRQAKNTDALRDLTAQVMVRTRRSSVAHALELPRRLPSHPPVALTPDEATIYAATVAFLRGLYAEGFIQPSEAEAEEDRSRRRRRTGKGILQLELLRLCQRLCSSSRALADSMARVAEGELVSPEYRGRALQISQAAQRVQEHAKLDALEKILSDHGGQVIVFSEHLPTLELIEERVRRLGRPPVLYQGGLSRDERAKRLKRFREAPAGVLVATRAGTEGLNLQFANVLVNYELPWNPMVVEQRIGRIHRIGQRRDCHIINLAASGTIEAHVLHLLDQKIKLFELVVGELDVILGEFGGADALEQRLIDEYLGAQSDAEFERALEAIGRDITSSRDAGMEQERATSAVAAEDNAMRLERDFRFLTIPARIRLGYGTRHLQKARGLEARREQLGLHVAELLEALEGAHQDEAIVSSEYGPLVTLTGVTKRGRCVQVKVKADQLPMFMAQLDADPEAPLAPGDAWMGMPAVAASSLDGARTE